MTRLFAVTIEYYAEPDLEPARRLQQENSTNFLNSYTASSSIGMHSSVFSLVTGSLIVVKGEKRFPLPDNTPKANIGLQLKFPKKVRWIVSLKIFFFVISKIKNSVSSPFRTKKSSDIRKKLAINSCIRNVPLNWWNNIGKNSPMCSLTSVTIR